MAVVKVKLKKNECKGDDSTKCKIKKDVELDNFIFDKCETCFGVFNYRKIVQDEIIVVKKVKEKKGKSAQKFTQSKMF